MITSEQIRAARALIRWPAAELALRSGIGHATIKRIEAMTGLPNGQMRTLAAIQVTLESAGIEFIGTPDENPGVRLRTPPKPELHP